MIEAMHRDGARVFVEVGPGSILTPLVESILGDRPHLAVSSDSSGSSGLSALLRCIARLVVAGLPLRLERLTAGRSVNLLDLRNLPAGEGGEAMTPSTWLVNGSRARPTTIPNRSVWVWRRHCWSTAGGLPPGRSAPRSFALGSNAKLSMSPRFATIRPAIHRTDPSLRFRIPRPNETEGRIRRR